ncbi:GntR family transcriptional regulator, transcriptional repressor for pyruvate dehydrogenase complex [Pararobbsia alpina]|uniref:FCD domain-containing protein n=1 Tax=Pararobbsia alpina TaxID=621374 RepID=UPI0039A44BFC
MNNNAESTLNATNDGHPKHDGAGGDQALNTRVRDALLDAIQSGELTPGAKLVEVEWANRLGVSRAPVREAFRALEQAGLLEMYRNRGVFVRTVSEHEADELRAVRALLESHACRLLAERLDAGNAAELHRLVDAMSDALTLDDRERYAQLNRAFHDLIVASAGNRKLHGIYRDMIDQLHLSTRAGTDEAPVDAMRGVLAEHRALVTALASRDADAAAQIMHRHIVTQAHPAQSFN